MEDFASIVRHEGWEYYPNGENASNRSIARQYRDKADRLSAASLMIPEGKEAIELRLLCADYILLAEIVESEVVAE